MRKVKLFEPFLSYDEKLLWTGRPQQGLRLVAGDLYLIPMSILWTTFIVFWIVMASSGGGIFGLFGIPFLIVGFYNVLGRFWVDAWQRSKTYYALTNQRIIILSGIANRNSRSVSLRQLVDINLKLNRDGRGTLTFGTVDPKHQWLVGTG